MLVWPMDDNDILFDSSGAHPLVTLRFWLHQSQSVFTEKDGMYSVTVNMDTGVIEDILYDSGRAANG